MQNLLKKGAESQLLLRGSRDFADRGDYDLFLHKLFKQLNAGRKERFLEEQVCLPRLPERRLETSKKLTLTVGPSGTIRIHHNVYSVHLRFFQAYS